ncbi:ornithine cyclodeaminase family protein, partial [Gelidibacter japonicus]|uniref:ornithine cyclodeaminase family protein n=1 Tax=Gelidibacter japonicus TaxID=1962232 RepID=UPI003A90BFAB
SPPKLAYNYKSGIDNEDNTLLIMPAWDNQKVFGVKLITATPNNSKLNIPYLNGLYMLFNAENGMPLINMDAKLITNMRTAATSVLASTFLAKKDASSVLIIGNGSLSPFYIEAYASLPTIDTVYLWGRNFEKSKQVESSINIDNSTKVKAVEDFSRLIKDVDIISCITSSYQPIIRKEHLSSGKHFDLVGSYTEDMQEVSTDVVANCSVYTDNLNITVEHAGELVMAIKEDKIGITDIKGDLGFLCKDDTSKRKSPEENTLFKCTGMAIEDLVIASLIYHKYDNKG